MYLDMARDAPDVVFTGESLLQEDVVFNSGVSIEVPSVIVDHGAGFGMRVYIFSSLHISGTLTNYRHTTQTLPIAFVVNGDVIIDGTLDVSGLGGYGGPGGNPIYEGEACTGNALSTSGASPEPGGSGAGGAQTGGRGGAAGNGEASAAAGPSWGEIDLEPLAGGCFGGSSRSSSLTEISWGGGGGGGIQIVSRTRISLLGNGVIDASGGGGSTGMTASGTLGGGGGGAGGNVLLEAPQIVLDGAGVVVSTKGGSGGAAGSGSAFSGSDGGIAAGATAGGINPNGADGGDGGIGGNSTGAGGLAPSPGEPGATSGADGGGGGGGAGRARFNTTSGFVNPINGAAIRASHISATPTLLRTRTVPVDPT